MLPELLKVFNGSNFSAKVMPHIFMVTDGGPEHHVNFHSVKIPLLILFRELRLQSLVAIRTALGQLYQHGQENYAHFEYWFPKCCVREKRITV